MKTCTKQARLKINIHVCLNFGLGKRMINMPNKKARVTITDVAKAANVSATTVSRILNERDKDGKIKISAQTKALVLKKAEELGYQLNPFASALRSKRTGLIGAIIRDIADPFPVKLAKRVRREVNAQGFELLIGDTEYDEDAVEKQLNLMVNHLFDGLLIFTHSGEKLLGNLEKYSVPYVTLTGGYQSLEKPRVYTNDREGIDMVLHHLLDLGHRNIGFIGRQDISIKQREIYFREIMIQHGFPLVDRYIETDAKSAADISNYFATISRLSTRPTAILCANDVIAIRAINFAHQYGFKVPEDLSIAGFDDIDQAAETSPALTTVQQPYEELAKQAVHLLIRLMNNLEPVLFKTDLLLSPRLVVRQSTGAAKA